MRFSFWPDQQRPWHEIAALVDHVESTGWDGVYVYDHFMPDDEIGLSQSGPVLEGWTTLTAIATRTSRLRLGTLVLGNLYRQPAVLANMAATLDHISGGRLVLGIGAGWQNNEHAAYGIDLPAPGARLDQFEEACQVITSLLRGGRTDFDGRYYRLADAPCEPQPLQVRLPVLIGGRGERRTLRIVAQFADEWNAWSTPEIFAHKSSVLDGYCSAIGRDPNEIVRSTQALIEITARPTETPIGTDRRPAIVGSIGQIAEVMAGYAQVGVAEFIVPDDFEVPLQQRLDYLDLLRTGIFESLR
jgi:F420-dependent oxidoreductase-like protein